MTTPYETLGVQPDATPAEIKRAYQSMAQKNHPDKPGGSHDAFSAIARGYDVLSDPDRRARYDETGITDSQPRPPAAKLAELFNAMIQKEMHAGNLIDQAKKQVNGAMEAIATRRTEVQLDLLKLERRTGRIECDGVNLYEVILTNRISASKRLIAALDVDNQLMQDVLILLGEYSDSAPEPEFNQSEWNRI